MFTAEDFLSYFTEIEMLERNMRDIYAQAAELLSDKDTKLIFETLAKQEMKHALFMEDLRKIAISKTFSS